MNEETNEGCSLTQTYLLNTLKVKTGDWDGTDAIAVWRKEAWVAAFMCNLLLLSRKHQRKIHLIQNKDIAVPMNCF